MKSIMKLTVALALVISVVSTGTFAQDSTKAERNGEVETWSGVWGSVKNTTDKVWFKTKGSTQDLWQQTQEVSNEAWSTSKGFVLEKDEEYQVSNKTKTGFNSAKEFFSKDSNNEKSVLQKDKAN